MLSTCGNTLLFSMMWSVPAVQTTGPLTTAPSQLSGSLHGCHRRGICHVEFMWSQTMSVWNQRRFRPESVSRGRSSSNSTFVNAGGIGR